jgi:hypothetical protein
MTKIRAYRSGITAKAAGGVIDFTFDIISPTKSPANPRFTDICGKCHEEHPDATGTRLESVLRCPTHGLIEIDDHLKGHEAAKGVLHPIARASEIKTAKEDIVESVADKKALDLKLVPWDDIVPLTFVGGGTYVLRVSRASDFTGPALRTLDEHGRITLPDDERPLTLVGQLMFDTNAKPVQLVRFKDMLVLRTIARPADIQAELPTWKPQEAPAKIADSVAEFLADAVEEFDPESLDDESRRLQAEWVAAHLNDSIESSESTGMTINELEAQLQALRAKKKPAKRAARKSA